MRPRGFGIACVAIVAAYSAIARAEIVKSATIDCSNNRLCLYWWPKLPSISGWHTDEDANYQVGENGINALVPDGFNFSNSDTVIYGNAVYKAGYEKDNPKSKKLDDFIADDRKTYFDQYPGMIIKEVEPLSTGDHQKLRSYIYFRPKDQVWEQISYGQDGDFYVVIAISSKSEAGYRAHQAEYRDLVGRYRK